MENLSLEELLENLQLLAKHDDLSPGEKARFLSLKSAAEEHIRAFKGDQQSLLQLEAQLNSIDNFVARAKKRRAALAAEVGSMRSWIQASADSLAGQLSELSLRNAKRKKKKEAGRLERGSPQAEALTELRAQLLLLAQRLAENIYALEQSRAQLDGLQQVFSRLVGAAEFSAPLCREARQSLEALLAEKRPALSVALNDVFDCSPLRPLLPARSAPYALSLIREGAAQPPFVDRFVEGFAALIGDDELTPFALRPPPPAQSVFPARRALSLEALRRLDVETLLVVFHFSADGYERLVAASQLKQREWRFHTQFNVWLKRAAPPREQTEQLERGDYHLFDWEERLAVKRIADLSVDYAQLEGRRQFS